MKQRTQRALQNLDLPSRIPRKKMQIQKIQIICLIRPLSKAKTIKKPPNATENQERTANATITNPKKRKHKPQKPLTKKTSRRRISEKILASPLGLMAVTFSFLSRTWGKHRVLDVLGDFGMISGSFCWFCYVRFPGDVGWFLVFSFGFPGTVSFPGFRVCPTTPPGQTLSHYW